MQINLDDTSFWLATDGEERFALRSANRDVVHLDRCHAQAWSMLLEHGEEVVIPVGEAWELALCDEGGAELGPVGERLLVRTGGEGAAHDTPDPGVLAWAAFGALCQISGSTPKCG